MPGNALQYVPNRKYEILVSTLYLGIEYYQKVLISIEQPPELPVTLLS